MKMYELYTIYIFKILFIFGYARNPWLLCTKQKQWGPPLVVVEWPRIRGWRQQLEASASSGSRAGAQQLQ